MRCISSSTMVIRFNGYNPEYFKSSQGLHQGNPLSPLIFNLCMALFSKLIQDTCANGRWRDIYFNNQPIHILHMSIVDDIVIFGEVDSQNVQIMLRMVGLFCNGSGQKINFTKSYIICSESIDLETSHFSFQEKDFLRSKVQFGYLGFSFIKNAKHTQSLIQTRLMVQSS